MFKKIKNIFRLSFIFSFSIFIIYNILILNISIIKRYLFAIKVTKNEFFNISDISIIKDNFICSYEHIDLIKSPIDFINYNSSCSNNYLEKNILFYLNEFDLSMLFFFDLVFLLFIIHVINSMYLLYKKS